MAKPTGDWKSLLTRFEVRGGEIHPVPRSALSRYEKQSGFMLPQSYCGYCVVFGPGDLDGGAKYSICTPYAKVDFFNLEYVTNAIKQRAISRIVDVEQFARGVFFSENRSQSWFFWDPHDVTNDEEHEYGIYVLHRDQLVERVSDSFSAFINSYCIVLDGPSDDYEFTFTPGE